MTPHTCNSLFAALLQLIPNLPRFATRIDIHLRPTRIATMTAEIECHVDGQPIIEAGAIKTEEKQFLIVPIVPPTAGDVETIITRDREWVLYADFAAACAAYAQALERAHSQRDAALAKVKELLG